MKGHFILRIEDTDLKRSTDESIQAIVEGLSWLGMDYDEGPIYQTKRFDHYKAIVQQLLDEGKAYRCYCSKDRLENLRKEQLKNKIKPRYDQCCRLLKEPKPNTPYVIRFKNPEEGSIRFDDAVCGTIEINNSELDDLIIVRPDGSPTYNFCVVVDDMDMEITHVIRGADHINNTPRQINIFKALGAKPPIYAHVPLILGEDKKPLSKRHGTVSVMQFQEEGFLPQALLNYLVRLGWSHGDQEIFSSKEMIDLFSLEHIHQSPAIFDLQKLLWLNQHYLKYINPIEIAEHLKWQMKNQQIDITQGPELSDVVQAQVERCKTLKEMAEKSRYFYEPVENYDKKSAEKHLTTESMNILKSFTPQLEQLTDWHIEAIHKIIIELSEKMDLKLGKIAQPIRVAVTGSTISPPIDITLKLIGHDRSIKRLKQAIDYING